MKTAIVTGAYGAIGKAIAAGIATDHEFKVIMVGRDARQLDLAVEEVHRQTGNTNLIKGVVDLSSKTEIEKFYDQVMNPVHVLVNNAATTPRQRIETKEDIEMQWAVNVLGYFYMTHFFEPHLTQAEGARVVNVASYWAGGLNLTDPEFKHRRYDNDSAYRQSKQANRMLTRKFAELYKEKNIMVNACHPGDVNSKLSNNLGFGGSESPGQGADTPVWLATSNEVQGISGKYFEHRTESSCSFMVKTAEVEKLYNLCLTY